jgi:hypothetical protein
MKVKNSFSWNSWILQVCSLRIEGFILVCASVLPSLRCVERIPLSCSLDVFDGHQILLFKVRFWGFKTDFGSNMGSHMIVYMTVYSLKSYPLKSLIVVMSNSLTYGLSLIILLPKVWFSYSVFILLILCLDMGTHMLEHMVVGLFYLLYLWFHY